MRRTAFGLFCASLSLTLPALPAAAGDLVVSGSLVSTVATGTAPLAVDSTTRVDNLNAHFLDGLDGSAFARSLGNVVLVAETGGDFASIQAALGSITDASSTNPYLVFVGPGIYTERVVMKPFVDIQGSGQGVTRITHSGGLPGAVVGADAAELRFLTVHKSGSSDTVIGIANENASPRLVHVTVEVDGTAPVVRGIHNSSGSSAAPELRHVDVVAQGAFVVFGISNQGAATRMHDVRVAATSLGSSAAYGIYNHTAAPLVENVSVVVGNPGTIAALFGVANDNLDGALFRSLRVEVDGGGTRFGIHHQNSSAMTIRDLEIEVSGDGSEGNGVYNQASDLVLERCSIDVRGGGGAPANALRLLNGSGEIRDCTLRASGSSGIYSALWATHTSGTYALDIQHSRFEGAEYSLGATSAYAIRVGASQLDGPIAFDADASCVFSYDGDFVALDANCE